MALHLAEKPPAGMAWVYLVTNTVNQKMYVGITRVSVRRRWLRHCGIARRNVRGSPALHGAIRKYGADLFVVTPVALMFSWDDACTMERELIAGMNTKKPNGYNVAEGGEGVVGLVVSEEHRRASSARSKGFKLSQQHCDRISAGTTGVKRTDESKARMSEVQKKRWADPEFRAKQLAAMQANKPDQNCPETRERRRQAQLGRKHSAETRAKMSEWQRGKPKSAETRAKISAAHTGKKMSPEQLAKNHRPCPEHVKEQLADKFKNRVFTDEWRAKISEGLRKSWEEGGKKHAAASRGRT
jgi:group I intron endonuclease